MNRKIIKHLDVSYNPQLTSPFYKGLGEIIEDTDCRLEVLELEGCKLNDSNTSIICEAILQSITLSVLNLSKNQITDKGVGPICKVIEETTSLKGLFLHYNKIMMSGGVKLAEQIKNTQFLEVFDISYNAIGGGIVTKDEKKIKELNDNCAKAWSDAFKFNQSLIHVDISHNHLRQPEVEIIGAGLKFNHNILGIHLVGNEGQVDPQGFIVEHGTLDKDGKGSIAKE